MLLHPENNPKNDISFRAQMVSLALSCLIFSPSWLFNLILVIFCALPAVLLNPILLFYFYFTFINFLLLLSINFFFSQICTYFQVVSSYFFMHYFFYTIDCLFTNNSIHFLQENSINHKGFLLAYFWFNSLFKTSKYIILKSNSIIKRRLAGGDT